MGALRKLHADHRGHVHRRLAGHRRRAAVRRLLVEGRDPARSRCDKSPVLWVVGLVTALLTAFYMTRQVIMVFFGEARWEDARTTSTARTATFKPARDARGSCCVPARRARRPVDRRRRASTCRSATTPSSSSSWLEPVVEVGERDVDGTERRPSVVLLAIAAVGRAASASSSPYLVYRASTRSRPIEPDVLADGWYYDEAVTAFMGGPGATAFEAVAWFDAHVVDGAVNGVGARRARHRRQRCARRRRGYVRNYAARHRRRRRAAARPGSSSSRGRPDGRSAFPILTTLVAACRRSARCVVALHAATAGPSCVQARRACSPACSPARSASGCSSRSTRHDAGFQFVSKHAWIKAVGHLVAPRRRRHLAVPRRAHRRAVPARASLGADPHHDDEAATLPGCCCSRPACMGASSASTCSCSSSSSRSCSCRCTSSSAAGATTTGVYAATKFFLYTMFGSAFMLVGIVATVVPRQADGVGHAHLRPRRASPSTPTFAAVDRALAVPRLRHRVRGQGAAVPAAHLAARRPHRRRRPAGSVILAGVMLKLGTYGFLRFGAVPVPRGRALELAPLLLTLGGDRHHLRRHRRPRCRRTSSGSSPTRRSPTSASSCSARSPSPPSAITGGVLQMINHGVSTGALFLLVGMIYERRHTREIAELKGLQKVGADLRRACSRS